MRIAFSKSVAAQRFAGVKLASITGATRLETQPTAVGMREGLKAPLADPLWMLARQWQFNEFQGEDAGTPLRIGFSIDGTAVDAFRSGADPQAPWQSLTATSAPIETQVEAEPVWSVHPRLRGEAGLHALRMASGAVKGALLAAYPLTLALPTDPDGDQSGLLWSTVFDQRTIDAATLAADLAPLVDVTGTLAALPAALVLDAGEVEPARAMLQRWFAWQAALVHEGDPAQASWQRNRMEYAFALKAGDVALRADEYTDGHVDWDDFRAGPAARPTEAIGATFAVATRHPSPVRYPGMPAERYWEFEDGAVNFAGAEAGVTDLLRMSVTEFALTFGNDWFVVPVRLPVGWLYRLGTFDVTDSFGVVTAVNAIGNPEGARWTMFEMTADVTLQNRLQHTMFLPDSLDGVQEGAVLDQTQLARDEMANVAWAIEQTVQGVSGEPLDRTLEAKRLAFQQQVHFKDEPDSPQLVYRLATPVPANWIPLMPTRAPVLNFGDPVHIQLARAGMKRFYPDGDPAVVGVVDDDYTRFLDLLDAQPDFITKLDIGDGLRAYVFFPRGHLLREHPDRPMDPGDTLILEEEEVPRIGATLKRKFQYARGSDGRTWLWIGRSKTAGRGEARSGLRYDVAVKKTLPR